MKISAQKNIEFKPKDLGEKKVLIPKLHGGRGTKIIQPKKGGPYKRERFRWSQHISTIALNLRGPIPERSLGKTGIKVPILSLGGESLLKITDKYSEAVELLRTAYEMGIRYFDTAAIYYPSEIRVGDALRDVRKNVIIATKTAGRTRETAWRDIDKSLTNLKTDYIDILQAHHIDHIDEVKTILGPDGAMKAFEEAQEQRVIRFKGISGHYDPRPLKRAIQQYDFDTILMAVNAADVHHESFIKNLLPTAVSKNMGIIGMKVCSRGRIFDPTHLNNMKDALTYVLNLPISTAIVGHDNIKQLIENIKIAQDFEPLTSMQMQELENKTKDYASLSLFFRKGYEEFNPWWKPYAYTDKILL